MEEKPEKSYNTEFHNFIVDQLKQHGYPNPKTEQIAILVENNDDNAYVEYNFMTTPIKLHKSEISQIETENAGFKWWATWNCTN